MMQKETIEFIKESLEGAICSELEVENGYLLLLFKPIKLIIQSSWQLSRKGSIIATDESACVLNDDLHTALIENRIIQLSVVGQFNNLKIEFTNGILFESFADSPDFENWSFVHDNGSMIIAGPGDLWSRF